MEDFNLNLDLTNYGQKNSKNHPLQFVNKFFMGGWPIS
jgi:hypothetical protein